MKGALTFSHQTSRTLKQLKKQYPKGRIEEIGDESFHITVPIDNIDPENPLKAIEDYREETGEEIEVYTLVLMDGGQTFTEEDLEEN